MSQESNSEPIVQIVTTGAPEGEATPRVPLWVRHRVPLLAAGGVLGALLLVLLGLGMGLFVREFNEKQYVEQITLLRGALQKNAQGWRDARLALEQAQAGQQQAEAAREKLAQELTQAKTALGQALEQARQASAVAASNPEPQAIPKQDGYLRFGNHRCVIRPGEKRQDLSKCLQDNQ
ncbi:hypothetical protein N8I74_06505 [Chitiniphilus purpureus]|uniref:Uncharacterized protein n=1 Tax=Chitiniphilus purpureus TaxID=2981137 RepID=A0ABY6DQM6_9NEIS|nr:hypothetical protein [Chitiniphilus sp. CD1]UXY16666.1 hypothetical protein N8I74_06505 [Chitiniphilus sp. CD1]